MNDTQKYKDILEQEKSTLQEELSNIARPNASNPDQWEAIQIDARQEADPNDQAALLDEYQENLAVVNVLNERYQHVISALQRIQKGNYGICAVGGDEIEKERLDADPTATTCIAHIS